MNTPDDDVTQMVPGTTETSRITLQADSIQLAYVAVARKNILVIPESSLANQSNRRQLIKSATSRLVFETFQVKTD